ncbi:response regulator [Caproiciproducens galactitolivorans]|uniref:Stage 0 sporulation protein A homolog n=1 Tax=Caproiciproducens galactitolivorans TaxID=642589 RepID=A0ABT4BXI5_9FIRM|nr:response regulator [Caproiciproducens galactitolivorans]MCY1714658.1 response regulator [Caproiciproducens galactitolivorans]
MKEIKVAVIDDSPFSVAMLSNMLEENGFQVVGSANNLQQAVDMVKEQNPDVVTMDITMPEADGIECTKALHKINPDLKVVIVSSMMDDEIMRKAKRAKISGYVQKPVDAEELTLTIRRIMADEELFAELEKLYYTVFKEALTDTFNKFFHSVPEYRDEETANIEQTSRGISAVIGIIGRYGGRMILDMSTETTMAIARKLFKIEQPTKEHIINVIGEISNIIAGNACSMMNKSNPLFGLRVAPPTIVYGESIKISKSELNTVTSVKADTSFGEIYMNIGFNRGECE